MVGMADTREHLLDLGETAVRSRGYAGFSYADLARDAGIKKASIHHHFPAKADLALALIKRYAERLSAALAGFLDTAPSAGSALTEAIRLYRDALGEGDIMCLCAALSTDTALLDERTVAALEETNLATANWFESVFERAAKDGSIAIYDTGKATTAGEAKAVLALLQGAQLLAKSGRSIDLFDQAVAGLQSRIKD